MAYWLIIKPLLLPADLFSIQGIDYEILNRNFINFEVAQLRISCNIKHSNYLAGHVSLSCLHCLTMHACAVSKHGYKCHDIFLSLIVLRLTIKYDEVTKVNILLLSLVLILKESIRNPRPLGSPTKSLILPMDHLGILVFST